MLTSAQRDVRCQTHADAMREPYLKQAKQAKILHSCKTEEDQLSQVSSAHTSCSVGQQCIHCRPCCLCCRLTMHSLQALLLVLQANNAFVAPHTSCAVGQQCIHCRPCCLCCRLTMHSLTISHCFVLVHVTVNKQCVPVLTSAGTVTVGNRLVYQSLRGVNTVMCLTCKTTHNSRVYIYLQDFLQIVSCAWSAVPLKGQLYIWQLVHSVICLLEKTVSLLCEQQPHSCWCN